jgi:hypothetical protein
MLIKMDLPLQAIHITLDCSNIVSLIERLFASNTCLP